MNKKTEEKIRLVHEIAVAGGVHAILTADQLGLLLAEIDRLREGNAHLMGMLGPQYEITLARLMESVEKKKP